MEDVKVIASHLESYLIRDVCKIVWDYFSGGTFNVVHSKPMFELKIDNGNYTYEHLYANGNLIHQFDDDGNLMDPFDEPEFEQNDETGRSADNKMLTKIPVLPIDCIPGTVISFSPLTIDLQFTRTFILDPRNRTRFFIVETKSNQLMMSFYPHQFIGQENIVTHHEGTEDYYIHPSGLQAPTNLQDMIGINAEDNIHKSTFIQFTFKAISNRFCDKFTSVYPL